MTGHTFGRRTFPTTTDGFPGRRTGPFGRVLAESNGRPMFHFGLLYEEDPSNPGFVLRFIDINDRNHWIEQTNPAAQVALPKASSRFKGDKCVTFTGNEYYVSNRAVGHASAPNYLHNGTGFELFANWCPTATTGLRCLVSTIRRQDLTGANGFFIGDNVSVSVQQLQMFCGRTNVTPTFSAGPTTATGFTIDTPTYTRARYEEGASPEFLATAKAASCLSGASAAAPAVGNAQSPLVVGANAVTFEDKLIGDYHSLLIGPRTDAFVAANVAYSATLNIR